LRYNRSKDEKHIKREGRITNGEILHIRIKTKNNYKKFLRKKERHKIMRERKETKE
jgi:hypothetical protein